MLELFSDLPMLGRNERAYMAYVRRMQEGEQADTEYIYRAQRGPEGHSSVAATVLRDTTVIDYYVREMPAKEYAEIQQIQVVGKVFPLFALMAEVRTNY